MMSATVTALFSLWLLTVALLILYGGRLFRKTWNEVYLGEPVLCIESDDWGAGAQGQAEALRSILDVCSSFRDVKGRKAVFTANVVLTAPDLARVRNGWNSDGASLSLRTDFWDVYEVMRWGMQRGVLCPQLHAKEHVYLPGLIEMAKRRDSVLINELPSQNEPPTWETLPHPLQAHYVNGTTLPSAPLSLSEQSQMVCEAVELFKEYFGIGSLSTVAPCYLWDDRTEKAWHDAGIRFIQTAGYRCTSLDKDGRYVQDPAAIRFGERNPLGQVYLVRTAMYEPADRHDAERRCWTGVVRALRQGLPAVISTHAYNYVGSRAERERALVGLRQVLGKALQRYPRLRFMSTPELGEAIEGFRDGASENGRFKADALRRATGPAKLSAFLYRLWYRHLKLRIAFVATLLIVPGVVALLTCTALQALRGTKTRYS